MRILYIDVDSLRADHLGCYGYHRNTSPTIDSVAQRATRFDNCYVSDAPCLPSRTALWSGRFGIQTGVVGHGGIAAEPFIEGPSRGFRDTFYETSWMTALRRAGYRTVTVSPFGERHGAWHWYAGFSEAYNPGKRGMEIADDVTPIALDWLQRNAQEDNWFLHVNYWDPHTPYRTPLEYGNPFADDPLPEWMTEEMRQRCWDGYGVNSPQEPHNFPGNYEKANIAEKYPRVPAQIDSMHALKRCIDGYDIGIRYVDDHLGFLFDELREAGVYKDTVIVISADHGESQGELNIFGDHQTADVTTSRIPLIISWPGLTDNPRVDKALRYHFDWAATLIEMVGGKVPENWDGISFAEQFHEGREDGREYLVVSQAVWSCQRNVRFNFDGEDFLCMRTYHDGYKDLAPIMLFNLTRDPHEQHNISSERPELVDRAMRMLSDWNHTRMIRSRTGIDPMMTVLHNGGPWHTRGHLKAYLDHLRATGREDAAEILAHKHPGEE